jgi:23S rRNA pseudouridine1911/1915/1917 synthase
MQRHSLVAPEGAGRVDAYLAAALGISRARVQRLIEDGHVTVDGELTRRKQKLRGGEAVEVTVPPPPTVTLEPQDLGVPMLHVDEAVIVVDKPAGLVVHPSRGHPDGTLVNALLHLLPTQPDGEGAPDVEARVRPGIVHRLDKGTSGVMVAARTEDAQTALAAQFAAHTVDRRYCALVWGIPKLASGTIDEPLGRHAKDRKRFAVRPGGKRAVTHYEVVGEAAFGVSGDARGGRLSLIVCRLETGRTHQIRVHLAHQGHPLVGDPLYGPKRGVPVPLRELFGDLDHQLLHAFRLGFVHPQTKKRCRFTTPLPGDFQAIIDGLGLSSPVGA